jgi:hypothetical protein
MDSLWLGGMAELTPSMRCYHSLLGCMPDCCMQAHDSGSWQGLLLSTNTVVKVDLA